MELIAQRKYWVGLNNRMGRLRYRYYKQRGWIKGEYYVKPEQPAWIEWAHCLVSRAHARRTWIRLTPEAEETALLWVKRVVIGLLVVVGFTAGMIVGEFRMLHHLQHTPQMIQLQAREQSI
jgi:hypothetical protein